MSLYPAYRAFWFVAADTHGWIVFFNLDVALAMMKFQLFDGVKLTEEITLTDGGVAPVGTVGAIVEVLNNGEAYIVELFGVWVKYDEQENFVPATQDEQGAFMETIGVETVYPQQLVLTVAAREIMGVREHLAAVLDDLSEDLVAEVRYFA